MSPPRPLALHAPHAWPAAADRGTLAAMEDRARRAREGYQMALALYEFGEATLRHKLRRKHPAATEEQIDHWVAEWQERRPGAEGGDGEGIVVPWPRRS